MGTGKIFNFHETDDTRASGATQAFEEIIERIKKAGGEVTVDEKIPLYDELGGEEAEIGYERVVEFNLNNADFKLIRKVQTHGITGAGRHKSLQIFDTPRVIMNLKRKTPGSEDWITIDLEGMF